MKLELSDELGAGSDPFGSKWEAGGGGFSLLYTHSVSKQNQTKQSTSRDIAQ